MFIWRDLWLLVLFEWLLCIKRLQGVRSSPVVQYVRSLHAMWSTHETTLNQDRGSRSIRFQCPCGELQCSHSFIRVICRCSSPVQSFNIILEASAKWQKPASFKYHEIFALNKLWRLADVDQEIIPLTWIVYHQLCFISWWMSTRKNILTWRLYYL